MAGFCVVVVVGVVVVVVDGLGVEGTHHGGVVDDGFLDVVDAVVVCHHSVVEEVVDCHQGVVELGGLVLG